MAASALLLLLEQKRSAGLAFMVSNFHAVESQGRATGHDKQLRGLIFPSLGNDRAPSFGRHGDHQRRPAALTGDPQAILKVAHL